MKGICPKKAKKASSSAIYFQRRRHLPPWIVLTRMMYDHILTKQLKKMDDYFNDCRLKIKNKSDENMMNNCYNDLMMLQQQRFVYQSSEEKWQK
jgi:hypothetical protein